MERRALIVVALVLAPSAAAGQTIHGTVVEEGTGHPIGGAEVEVRSRDGGTVASARSHQSGLFVVRLDGPGTFTLRTTHLGYATVESDTLSVGANESVAVELRMAVAAIPHEPLVVVARADGRGLAGFRERMQRPGAAGHYITREAIVRKQGGWVTDVVREVPGVNVQRTHCGPSLCGHIITMRGAGVAADRVGIRDDAGGVGAVSARGRTPTDQCLPTVYVDGIVVDQGDNLDALLRPEVLEGVEVYTRGSAAPPPILARDACGVVAFWTRDDDYQGFDWKRFGAWLGGLVVVFTLSSR